MLAAVQVETPSLGAPENTALTSPVDPQALTDPSGAREVSAARSTFWTPWLHNAIGAAVLIGFGAYLWLHRRQFLSALEVSSLDVLSMAGLVLLTFLVTATQSYLLFRGANVSVSFRENLALALASYFGNYLPMRAGTLVRARYLKAVHRLRYARFGSVSGVRALITVMATGVMGLAGVMSVALGGGPLSFTLLTVFLGAVLAPCMMLLWRAPDTQLGQGRLRRIIADFAQGFVELRSKPRMAVRVAALLLIQYAILGARFMVASHAIGRAASPSVIVLLAPLAALASFAAFTPGALGVREALMGYVTHAAGTSFASGVFVGTLDRAILLGMSALLGGPSFVWVWRRARRTPGSPASYRDVSRASPRASSVEAAVRRQQGQLMGSDMIGGHVIGVERFGEAVSEQALDETQVRLKREPPDQ
jgi:uncharacterized membrane protein YbhN (UPF0104 family)